MSCGEIKFLEGGALTNANFLGGNITQAVIQGSAIDACNITKLRDIDTASAEAIMSAIAKLPPTVLSQLAEALSRSSKCCCVPTPPSTPVPPPFTELVPPAGCVPPPPPVMVVAGEDDAADEDDDDDDDEPIRPACNCNCHHPVEDDEDD